VKAIVGVIALLAAGAAESRALAPQKFIQMKPGTYTALGTSVSIKQTGRKVPHYHLSIRFPGGKSRYILIDDHGWGDTVPPSFAVGRLSASGPPVVWVESNSGGAHCCRRPRLIIPSGARTQLVELGGWDGETQSLWPDDEDGDGQRDLIFADNRFLYAFTSYAASYAPPRIYNVVNGKMVDVSTKPGFRKIYVSWMKNAWKDCMAGGRGGCAAYVAGAARIGKEPQAWAEMLKRYDRNSDWELPPGCRVKTPIGGTCPEKQELRFRTYPEALRYFLVQTGYLKR
jgi:hypothetical protein